MEHDNCYYIFVALAFFSVVAVVVRAPPLEVTTGQLVQLYLVFLVQSMLWLFFGKGARTNTKHKTAKRATAGAN